MNKIVNINGQRFVEVELENPLWEDKDFRRIATFSGITPESSKEEFTNFCGCLRDAGRYGCASGCLGSFIYTVDNARFFDEHREAIARVLFDEECDSLDTIIRDASLTAKDIVLQSDSFKEWMTWAYVESVAFRLSCELDEQIDE